MNGGADMTQLHQIAATHTYWYPAEQAEREQLARRSALAAQAHRLSRPNRTRRSRTAFVPRIAGALGLF
jgi:hypothetical protein